jgi:uncharacterized protein (DUF1684 family)
MLFSQSNYKEKIRQYQKNQIENFRDENTSPLTRKDLKEFKTLPFFPINPNYRIVAFLACSALAR